MRKRDKLAFIVYVVLQMLVVVGGLLRDVTLGTGALGAMMVLGLVMLWREE